MHEILQHGQRNGFGYVDNGLAGRVPTAAATPRAFTIETGVRGPANAEDSPGHLRRNIVLNTSKNIVDLFFTAARQNLRRAQIVKQS
jgi:hypothetical protein